MTRECCPLCNVSGGHSRERVLWMCPSCESLSPPDIHMDCLEAHCMESIACPVCNDPSLAARGSGRLAFAGIRRVVLTVAVILVVYYSKWRLLITFAIMLHCGLDGRRLITRMPLCYLFLAPMLPILVGFFLGLDAAAYALCGPILLIDVVIISEYILIRCWGRRGTIFTRPVWWMAFGSVLD